MIVIDTDDLKSFRLDDGSHVILASVQSERQVQLSIDKNGAQGYTLLDPDLADQIAEALHTFAEAARHVAT
jgi:hypothetical protein